MTGRGIPGGALMWRKSDRSKDFEGCVEIAALPATGHAVRDSKDPTGPILLVTGPGWAAFTSSVKEDHFG